jgi:hypothetical protein
MPVILVNSDSRNTVRQWSHAGTQERYGNRARTTGRSRSSHDRRRGHQLLEFFTVFVDKCHHGKEEELLFPAMEQAGGKGLPQLGPFRDRASAWLDRRTNRRRRIDEE